MSTQKSRTHTDVLDPVLLRETNTEIVIAASKLISDMYDRGQRKKLTDIEMTRHAMQLVLLTNTQQLINAAMQTELDSYNLRNERTGSELIERALARNDRDLAWDLDIPQEPVQYAVCLVCDPPHPYAAEYNERVAAYKTTGIER